MDQNLTDPNAWLERYEESAIKDRYQMLREILQEPLTKEWLKEIDWVDILLQMSDEIQSCNLHQEMLAFVGLIRENQPKFYRQEFSFYDRFVVQYALYTKDNDLLETGLAHFAQYPGRDLDNFFAVIDLLIFYEQTDRAIELAETTYPKILSDRDLDNGLAEELAWLIITQELGQIYDRQQQGNPCNWQQYQFHSGDYDFDVTPEWQKGVQEAIEQGFDADNFLGMFKRTKLRPQAFLALSIAFYCYMRSHYQMSFGCAQRIWSNICGFWDVRELTAKQKTNPSRFFGFTQPELEQHLTQKIFNPFSLKQAEGFATLWGLPYLYEFLLDRGIIREPIYKKAIAIIDSLKTELLAGYQNNYELWHYDFINRWQPDRSTLETITQGIQEQFQANFAYSEPLTDVAGEGHLEQMFSNLAETLGIDPDAMKSVFKDIEDDSDDSKSETLEAATIKEETTPPEPQPKTTNKKSRKKKKKSGFGIAAELYKK